MRRKVLIFWCAYIVVVLYVLITALPIVWVVLGSFKDQKELRNIVNFILFSPTTENYQFLFSVRNFGLLLRNSIVTAGGGTLVVLPVAFAAAYALTRFKIRGRRIILLGFLATRMIPYIALVVPLYDIFRHLHLINTLHGLLIVYIACGLPITIWILTGFLQGVPLELEEAALIDGCSRFKAMIKVILPLSAPGFATAAIFCFLTLWSDFALALILSIDERAQTAQVGLTGLISAYGIEWGPLLAGSTILILPMIFFVVFAQRFLVEGLTGGALK